MRPELLTVFPWEGGTQSPQSSLMHITFLSPYCCIISLFIVARQAAIRINTHTPCCRPVTAILRQVPIDTNDVVVDPRNFLPLRCANADRRFTVPLA